MDMRNTTYPQGFFDGLFLAYSLIHIPSSEIGETLNNFYKILKTDGVILILVQKGEPDRIIEEPLKSGERIFLNLFTKKRLAHFLRLAHFNIIYQKEVYEPTYSKSPGNNYIFTLAKK